MDLVSIPFTNTLGYDINLYDSFNPDQPTSDEDNYLGHLTLLGTVKSNTSADIKTIRSCSAFVAENAASGEPLARFARGPISKVAGYTIGQSDEDAMTETIKFISFLMFNPDHAMTKAFNALWNDTSNPLLPAIDNFFSQYPDYNKCNFKTYMMGITYIASHPDAVITPFPVYSLSGLVKHWGGVWPDGMPDITISHFSFTFINNQLKLGIYIDLSTLPYETKEVADNVKTLGYKDTTVKVTLQTNFQISLGIFGTRITIDFDDFKIPTGSSSSIAVTKPEAIIDINPTFKFVVFTLKGMIPFKVNNTKMDADISLTIDNEEAHVGAVIAGDGCSFPAPPVLKGLFFDEVGIGMGLFFKPPAFSFGLETKFHLGTPKSGNIIALDDDTAVMVFKTSGEIPVPVFISFYVPRMDINEIVELFTNVNPDLDSSIIFSNLSFKWCENIMDPVVLPDGSLASAGYAFSGNADVYAFQFYGDVSLDLEKGLTAEIEMSPINWKNVFQLTGSGKGKTIKVDSKGSPIKNNFIPTTQAEKDEVEKATETVITTAGGPLLIINTLSMPLLQINAKASLFELIEYDIIASIDKEGIKFELDYGVILTKKMICNLTNFHNFYGQFGYYIDKSIPLPIVNNVSLGSLQLKSDTSIHFSINTSTTDIVLGVGGQFDFEGFHFTFGDFNADISISKISDFISAIIDYLIKEAKTIFSAITDKAEEWAKVAGKGIVTGFDDAGKVMKNVYGKSKEEMVMILKDTGFVANDIAKGLKEGYGLASQVVASLLRNAGYEVSVIGGAIKNAWNCGMDDITWALKEGGFDASEVTFALKKIFGEDRQAIVNSLKKFGFAVHDICMVLVHDLGYPSQVIASLLKNAGYDVKVIGAEIKSVWNCGIDDVTWALKEVGFSIKEVADSILNAFGPSFQNAVNSLKKFGYQINELCDLLKNGYGFTADVVAGLFKGAGFELAKITSTIKDTWNYDINFLSWVLRSAGFAAKDVAIVIKDLFHAEVVDVIGVLKYVGYGFNEVAATIKNEFNKDSIAVAAIMQQVGYTVEEIANGIKNAWNCTINDVVYALNAVGFIATDIARGVKDAFNALAQDTANALKKFGIAAEQTAEALASDVYNLSINEAGAVLKQAGYATNEVASALKDAFHTTVNAVADAMKQIGYAANDVKNAFEQLGGDFKSFADTVFKDAKHYLNPSNW